MIVKISRKLATTPDGPWLPIDQVPQKVLLETDQENERYTKDNPDKEKQGVPAIKIGTVVFYFGQPHDKVTKYRVLALQTVVSCIQE